MIIINIYKTVSKLFITFFACATLLNNVSVSAGKDKKDNITIHVNLYNCRTQASEFRRVTVSASSTVDRLNCLFDNNIYNSTDIIKGFLFSKRYISKSETFKKLKVKDNDTITCFYDTNDQTDFSYLRRVFSNITIESAVNLNLINDIKQYKQEGNEYLMRTAIRLGMDELEKEDLKRESVLASKSLPTNVDYKSPASPNEEPLPILWDNDNRD